MSARETGYENVQNVNNTMRMIDKHGKEKEETGKTKEDELAVRIVKENQKKCRAISQTFKNFNRCDDRKGARKTMIPSKNHMWHTQRQIPHCNTL